MNSLANKMGMLTDHSVYANGYQPLSVLGIISNTRVIDGIFEKIKRLKICQK